MRPRESPASGEAFELLKRAQSLLEKAEKLDMVEHEGKKVPAFAADGKGPEDEKKKGSGKCPSCGGKMDMEKGMCMKAGCGSMKQQPAGVRGCRQQGRILIECELGVFEQESKSP